MNQGECIGSGSKSSSSSSSNSKSSLYNVLGVDQYCSGSEIRAAYRKLAMKYHPDKCVNPDKQGNSKFQDVQEAYRVLSDDNKRFLYDAGLYNEQDDEGMQDFMGEMAGMMSTSSKSSFTELQDMFQEMVDSYSQVSSRQGSNACSTSDSAFSNAASSNFESIHRCSKAGSQIQASLFPDFDQRFCLGTGDDGASKPKPQRKPQQRRRGHPEGRV